MDPEVHFGLSSRQLVDSVSVTWPTSGRISVIRNIPANQVLDIDLKDTEPTENRETLQDDPPERLFSRIHGLIPYRHQQEDMIDYYYTQNIMPHKFSQIGPIVHQGDLDGNGAEDLIIAATGQLPTTIFLKKGNRFEKTTVEGLSGNKNAPESGFASWTWMGTEIRT